ncbi:MAG: hypothetical protein M1840_002927 [Geoglossum simile]|nr:MAG: hypothetical protein M1840_002927 [Geoglossum simile]
MPVPQSDEFKDATVESRRLKGKPNDKELLEVRHLLLTPDTPRSYAFPAPPVNLYRQLYALFKQGTQDPPFDGTAELGLFDFRKPQTKGKAKKAAWENLVLSGVTHEVAQRRYVDLVGKLKETYGYDANKTPEAVGAGS